MLIERISLGQTADGTDVYQFTATNAQGLKIRAITLGATLTAVEVPDRNGKLENVSLYLETLGEYLAGHPCFGSICGRYANRIARGRFTLDGATYQLATNNGPNHLHGGRVGFHRLLWKGESLRGDDWVGARFTLDSPDGDEGYPGKLTASVTYRLTNQDELVMEYTAQTDKPTHVNLTNHAYWNLAGAGEGDCLGHLLMLNADRYLPVDDTQIPLGPPAEVRGTPMDFTRPQTIGSRIAQVKGGYDHCYVLNKKPGEGLSLAARVVEPRSGRVMEVYTTEPGVQLYTANGLDGRLKAAGKPYVKHGALCLEAQHYPDSPNRPEYPTTVLRPGQTYRQTTIHKFSVEKIPGT